MFSQKQEEVFSRVVAERERQDRIHPDSPSQFMVDAPAILGEEVGEVHKAWLERDTENLKEELVQVMAVCCRWLEYIG